MSIGSFHERAFRALLRLFPAEFRGDFGAQMIQDFRDQRQDAAASGHARGARALWLRTSIDLIRRAPMEHLDVLWRDAVYAVRILRRHAASTLTAVLTLAIGIGLNTAVFSVVSGVLWRDLPFPESDRLVRLFDRVEKPPQAEAATTPGYFLEMQRQARSFEKIGAAASRSMTIVEPGKPELVVSLRVTDGFFDVLRVQPLLGRFFLPDDYAASITDHQDSRIPPQPTLAVISHTLWQRRFLGRPDIVGQKMRLRGGGQVEIVGVAGQEMTSLPGGLSAAVWVPEPPDPAQRSTGILTVIGRLAPGVSVAAARAELDVISARLSAADPRSYGGRSTSATPFLETIVRDVRTELRFLFGAVVVILLVTCANVANLFLAHASGRRLELTTRVALGATRAHLVRQTLTESLLVATVGGAGGLLLALWAVPALVAMAPPEVPRLEEIGIDWATFAFAAVVSISVGLICGMAACLPLDTRRVGVVVSQMRSTAAPSNSRFRRGLTVVEVALALILVIAAALMVRTMRELGALDLGFDPASVVAATLPMNRAMVSAGNIAGLRQRDATIVEQVRALPGVKAAGIGLGPLTGSMGLGGLIVPGDTRDFGILGVDSVSVGYFEALGARLTAGRFFDDTDAINPQTVVVVNEAAARLLWPRDNPIGKELINYKQRLSVIGVVKNMRAVPLEDEPRPRLFLLHLRDRNFFANTMLVRTNSDPESLVPAIRTIFKRFDGEHPFRGVEPLQDRIDRAMAPRIFILRVVGLFSLIGMLLAVVGIYGVVAESVAQRVPEIGVRMALGARASDVRELILRQGAGLVAVGITFGLIGAYVLRGVMTTMVFGVQTLDPIAYVVACVVLGVTTLAACAIPASRAARLDPVAALRLGIG